LTVAHLQAGLVYNMKIRIKKSQEQIHSQIYGAY